MILLVNKIRRYYPKRVSPRGDMVTKKQDGRRGFNTYFQQG